MAYTENLLLNQILYKIEENINNIVSKILKWIEGGEINKQINKLD